VQAAGQQMMSWSATYFSNVNASAAVLNLPSGAADDGYMSTLFGGGAAIPGTRATREGPGEAEE